MTYGYLSANSDRILQPNLAGGANPSNSHFNDPGPQFSSIVGGVSGCVGAGGSATAIQGNGNPGYNMEKIPYHHHHQKGGSSSHRRGGHKRSGHKRSGHKKRHQKRSNKKRSNKKRSHKKRSMRGGLTAFSPASFSGASSPPYHQFMGGQPTSYNFALGGSKTPLPPNLIGLASPPPMTDIHNNCGSS
jgi:hypothetical protein